MQRNFIDTWKKKYLYFEVALEDNAREWVEGTLQREPGRTHLRNAMAIGAPDVAWALPYRCVRLELLRKVGIPYEDPAELAQAQWDAMSMRKRWTTRQLRLRH